MHVPAHTDLGDAHTLRVEKDQTRKSSQYRGSIDSHVVWRSCSGPGRVFSVLWQCVFFNAPLQWVFEIEGRRMAATSVNSRDAYGNADCSPANCLTGRSVKSTKTLRCCRFDTRTACYKTRRAHCGCCDGTD